MGSPRVSCGGCYSFVGLVKRWEPLRGVAKLELSSGPGLLQEEHPSIPLEIPNEKACKVMKAWSDAVKLDIRTVGGQYEEALTTLVTRSLGDT